MDEKHKSLGDTMRGAIKAARDKISSGPKKVVPRDPTPEMVRKMTGVQQAITTADVPTYLAVWRAGFDAAPGESE